MQILRSPFIVFTLLALCFLACFVGFYSHGWHALLPWGGAGLPKYIALIALILFVYFVFWKMMKLSPWFFGVLVCFFVTLVADVFWPFLTTIIFLLSSLCLGRLILKLTRYEGWANSNITSFLVGVGVYGTLTGVLAHFSFNYSSLYLLLTIIPFALSPNLTGAFFVSIFQSFYKNIKVAHISWLNTYLMLGMLVHFIFALMPEVGNDALVFHLFVATQMKSSQGWSFNPDLYAFAVIPMLANWIFSFAYLLGGEAAARLENLIFTYVLMLQCYNLALWLGANERAAKIAALIFIFTPIAFLETNSIFVEGVWSAYILAALTLLLKFTYSPESKRQSINLAIAGLFIGLALTAKVITVNILLCFSPILLFHYRAFIQRQHFSALVTGLCLLLLIGLQPYVYAFFVTSNPIFPFFNAIFKSPFFPVENFDNPLFKTGLTWDFIYRIIFKAEQYIEGTTGAGGFQFLLGLPIAFCFALYNKNTKVLGILVFSLASIALIFYSQSYLRYIYPFYVFLTAAILASISPQMSNESVVKKPLLITVGAIVFLNALFLSSASWCYRSVPYTSIINNQLKKNFIYERLPVREAIDLVNVINVEKSPVAFVTQNTYAAFLDAEALYPHWYNYSFQNALNSIKTENDFIKLSKKYRTNIFIIDSNWRSQEVLKIVLGGTNLVFDFGRFSVRKLKEDLYFSTELLKNTDFDGLNDWNLAADTHYDSEKKFLVVSLTAHAMQVIAVAEKTKYLQEITASCHQLGAKVRLQINWVDKNKAFLAASNEVFDCKTDWAVHRQSVQSPGDAAYAVVYAAAYDDKLIKVKRVSLK